jgi:hypothetical protein
MSNGTTSYTGARSMQRTAVNSYNYFSIPSTYQIRAGFFFKQSGQFWSADQQYIFQLIGPNVRLKGQSSTLYIYAGSNKDSYANPGYDWKHFGIDAKIDPSAGWFDVYLNGASTPVMSWTGNTGSNPITSIRLTGWAHLVLSGTVWLDDVYVDDTTGESSGTPPPIIRFYPLTMDGNGNYAQWVGSDADSTDNYLHVDEVPSSTADYVESDAADEFDSYTMTGITLDTGQTINAVIPAVDVMRAGTTEEIALGTRLSSTDLIGSDQEPPGAAHQILSERQTTKPGGGAWTESDVNSAELVIKSRGSY